MLQINRPPFGPARVRAASVAFATFLAACVYPTERGEEVTVELDAVPPLIEGEEYSLSARVMSMSGSPVPNAVVTYESSNPLIALVTAEGELLATGAGTVEIAASVLGISGAQVANQQVRIHGVLDIDSMTPNLVRWGELVNIYGSGLSPDSLFGANLGGFATVIEDYTPATPDSPHRFGVLRVWAKFPAHQQVAVQIFGVNGLALSPDSIRVRPLDVYEPNDTVPWDFGPLVGTVGNPALAFERKGRDDSVGVDWYRFTQTAVGDRSFVVRPTTAGIANLEVYLTDGISWQGLSAGFQFGASSWVVSRGLNMCQGIPLAPPQAPDDSVVVALKDLPPGQYDLFAVYEGQGAYQLGIFDNYRSQLAPDPAEENDYCDRAAPIVLGTVGQYTIDNPHDVDWYSVTLTDTTNVTLDVVAGDPDADLDLYVLRSFLPDSLQVLGSGQTAGTNDDLSGRFVPGDYFFLVIDFEGVPTPYSLVGRNVAVLPDHPNAAQPVATFRRGGDGRGLSPGAAVRAASWRR